MILFFHDLYSHVKNHPLIAQFYSFKKNVSQNIFSFSFLHKLNFNAKVIILHWPHHLLFWWWGFREDLMLFHFVVCRVIAFCGRNFTCHMIYILIGRICIILPVGWFIFSLGESVSSCSLDDLYSHLGNLYHFVRCMIYILIGRIVSSAHRMIYILIGRICIICC